MQSSRETIYQAVFDILSKAPGLVTATRRFRPFAQVSQAETPILMTVQRKENPGAAATERNMRMAMPYVWDLSLWCVVYVASNSDPNFVPATPLNAIVDYVVSVIPPATLANPNMPGSGYARNTLGIPGVYQVQIDGDLEWDEGLIAPASFVGIPIRILAL